MILGIDIGNTNIVITAFEKERMIRVGRVQTDIDKTPEYYVQCIKKIIAQSELDQGRIEDAIISSVVPQIDETIQIALRILLGTQALCINENTKTGLEIEGEFPQQLGVDVVVGCVAAKSKYSLPLVVVDMGTATTFAVLNKEGVYIGGMIVPGPRLFTEALSDKTAQLSKTSINEDVALLGQQTSERIRSGMVYGNASLIDGVLKRIEQTLCERPVVVGTGGYLPLILPYCEQKIMYDDLLIPRGLSIIYDQNR